MQASTSLDESPFCLGYELSQCEEESDWFVLRIEWTSAEDHLSKFRSSQQFREFLPHVRPFIESIEEMRHYHTIGTIDLNAVGRSNPPMDDAKLETIFGSMDEAKVDAIMVAIQGQKKIEAIKLLRSGSGLGLMEAKRAVETILRNHSYAAS